MKISKESSGINLVDSENSIYYLNFQGCFTVQLSRFFVLLSFSATACSFYLIKSVLSRTFLFYLVESFSFEQLVYINSFLSLCQELFELIIQASGEGGI